MTGIELLTMQLVGSCDLAAKHAEKGEPHWQDRAFTGASQPGFVAWHCARIIDWGVHTVVRNVPEIASQAEWSGRVRYEMGHGAGLGDGEADDIAATVQPRVVVEYAHDLRQAIVSWLGTVDAAELDQVPDLRARNHEHPRYRTESAWEEIKHLEGIPAWQFLARPCGAHIRVHSGEVDTLIQLLRSQHVTA